MQSYKLRKNSETSLFPIEDELRKLRNETDKSWLTLMEKIMGVVFSGIGTTLACQTEYLPAFIKWVLSKLEVEIPNWAILLIQFLVAAGIFIFISYVANKFINWKNRNVDNKKDAKSRQHTAEYFHKVILNNIITAMSFAKKAKYKLNEIETNSKEADAPSITEENKKIFIDLINELKQEGCLYIAQAIFYLGLAKQELTDEKIVELGSRPNYVEYLKEVGVVTLIETLIMYEKTLTDLVALINTLIGVKYCEWDKNKCELIMLKDSLKDIEDLERNILNMEVSLNHTIKEMNN